MCRDFTNLKSRKGQRFYTMIKKIRSNQILPWKSPKSKTSCLKISDCKTSPKGWSKTLPMSSLLVQKIVVTIENWDQLSEKAAKNKQKSWVLNHHPSWLTNLHNCPAFFVGMLLRSLRQRRTDTWMWAQWWGISGIFCDVKVIFRKNGGSFIHYPNFVRELRHSWNGRHHSPCDPSALLTLWNRSVWGAPPLIPPNSWFK